VATVENELQGL